jgi:AcrR family transcriptional regulator
MNHAEPVVKNERSFYSRPMPRVSDEHRAQRRQQILDAARRCFIRDGFHQTSMVDIFTEAHLSAGAVYGYFKGKNDIIIAIADDVVGRIAEIIRPIIEQDPTPTVDVVVRAGLTEVESWAFDDDGAARLAPQVWAEAIRNPELAAVIQARYAEIGEALAGLAVKQQEAGRIAADANPRDVVPVIFGAIFGYILQRLLYGAVTPDSYADGLAALTHPRTVD